jgi:arabinose-5-phosphate isomerase
MKKNNFKKEDFASFHPGGSLGKKLFVKIKDIMRTEDLPIVPHRTSIKSAIVKMGEGMIGSVLVIDDQNKLVAILSDGDLRRALAKTDFSINNEVLQISTKNPIVIKDENTLATNVLNTIEKNKIQLIVVVDKQHKISGVVHIHDLVEAGIK